MNNFGKIIRQLRIGKNMSQQALANAANMGQSDISKLERGVIHETAAIVRLAMALDVSPIYLETGDERYANLRVNSTLPVSGDADSDQYAWVHNCDADIRPQFNPEKTASTAASIQLCRKWISNQLPDISHADNLALLSVIDSGMKPTFERGDMLLIDRGVTTIEQSAIYVFGLENSVFVRRIVHNPITRIMSAKSDNTLHGSFDIGHSHAEKLRVYGRICFVWRGTVV